MNDDTWKPARHGRGPTHTATQRGRDRGAALRSLIGDRPVVYALDMQDGTIKIGCTTNLIARRSHLGADAEILAFVFGDLADEQEIHRSLVAHRARGQEFYHRTNEVLAVVNSMRDQWNLPHLAA